MWGDSKRNQISEFLRKLLTAYSKYFNAKYNRTGSLFEGSFKSEHISDDVHAKYLFSYIHLNPIKLIDRNWKKDGIKNTESALTFLRKYKWSSYLDHVGNSHDENKILKIENFPKYFKNLSDVDNEILNWIT